MKAIFIGGPLDKRMEEIREPLPPTLYVGDFNVPMNFYEVEKQPVKQIAYQRTRSTDGIAVYVMVA